VGVFLGRGDERAARDGEQLLLGRFLDHLLAEADGLAQNAVRRTEKHGPHDLPRMMRSAAALPHDM